MLDDIDRRLLGLLQRDSRVSNSALGRQLGISGATVGRRIERIMERQLLQFTAIPDFSKLGYDASAYIALEVQQSKVKRVATTLVRHPNTRAVTIVLGRFDIVILVDFSNKQELMNFLTDELSHIDGVVRSETFYILEQPKRIVDWFRSGAQASG